MRLWWSSDSEHMKTLQSAERERYSTSEVHKLCAHIMKDHPYLSLILSDNKKMLCVWEESLWDDCIFFIFPLPATNWNEMISYGDKWENHCTMPVGWFSCFSSHFRTLPGKRVVWERKKFNNIQFHSKSHTAVLFLDWRTEEAGRTMARSFRRWRE